MGTSAGNLFIHRFSEFSSGPTKWSIITVYYCRHDHSLFYVVLCSISLAKEKYGRYNMWVSVSRMLQPLIGLYIGFFIWQENIRIDYIIFTTIFLAATIIIRYFDEIGESETGSFCDKTECAP